MTYKKAIIDSKGDRKFLSIQWKAVFTTTFLMIFIFSINIGYNVFQMKNQFYNQQNQKIKTVNNQIKQTLEKENQSLQTHTSFIMSQIRKETEKELIKNIMDDFLWTLEIDYDVKSIAYHGRELLSSGISPHLELIHQAKQKELPQSSIYCLEDCFISFATTYLVSGEIKVIFMSKSISQLLQSLNEKSPYDFILMQEKDSMNEWPHKIIGKPQKFSEKLEKEINQFTKSTNFDDVKRQPFYLEDMNGSHKSFSIHNPDSFKNQNLFFLVVEDYTSIKEEERELILGNIILGGIAITFIEIFLLIIMWPPLKSLKNISLLLPLVSQSKYEQAKKEIDKNIEKIENSPKIFYDETDRLNYSISDVCKNLQDYSDELSFRNKKLSELAHNDMLTGISNRRHFKEQLEKFIKISKRSERRGAIIFFDLDNFKDVNDGSGHHVGDNMLMLISERLKSICRKRDLIARMGGDEFAIIIPDVNEEEAIKFGEKIRDEITQIEIAGLKVIHKVSASVGIVMIDEKQKNYDNVIYYADIAMYKAKELGKNTVYIIKDNDKNSEETDKRVYWAEKVKEEKLGDSMKVVYQPIFNFHENKISHYEALTRVKDQNGQYCSPVEYIKAAERTGNILKMDKWVLTTVCNDIKNKINKDFQKISVNISALSFSNENLVQEIESIFYEQNVSPERVIFEITETAAIQSFRDAIDKMNKIKSLGCQLALDDFGTGFSSFYNLKKLPIDYVKIDGSFIKRLSKDKGDQILVKALVYITKQYGERTIAEFVENQETMDALKEIGVDYAQGYYISKPIGVDELT